MVNDMTMSEHPYTVYLLLKEDTGILKTATVYVGPIPKIYEKFSDVKIYFLHMETRLKLDNKEYDIETDRIIQTNQPCLNYFRGVTIYGCKCYYSLF